MENEKKKRPSKATVKRGGTWGVQTQKMMSFRLDTDLIEPLSKEANKGRLINDLIRKHYQN